MESLDECFKNLQANLVAFRRDMHQHPEPGFKEFRTQQKIMEALKDLPNIKKCAETGLVIDIKGQKETTAKEPFTVALRADIDALKMTEANHELEYKSKNEGIAHMCGHDGHTTCLIGAGLLLHRAAKSIPSNCTVRLLFQPAEEGPGGADPMIKEGCLDGVNEVYGMHNWPAQPVGKLSTIAGPCMAHVTEFIITITGKGGHASQPQDAIDPVVVSAQVILAIQTIVSRSLHPRDTACVSITCVQGGETFNVIPDRVVLKGTTRDLNDDAFKIIKSRMENIVQNVCESYGAKGVIEFSGTEYCPLINTPKETDHVMRVARKMLGDDKVNSDQLPLLAAEDFASYVKLKPGCFFFLGTGVEGKKSVGLHCSTYNFNDDAIPYGVKMWVRLVEDRISQQLYN